MSERGIVVYGTGTGARAVVVDSDAPPIIAVVTSEEVDKNQFFHGIPVFDDNFLLDIEQDFSLIIASQYFDDIYNRLTRQGKLSNHHLKEILVPNLLGQGAPYDGDLISPVTEVEYGYLSSLFRDKHSLCLLNVIKKERNDSVYPSVRYLPIREGLIHAGFEDYWISVKPTQKHSRSVVIDAGAYIGDSISAITERIRGGTRILRFGTCGINLSYFGKSSSIAG